VTVSVGEFFLDTTHKQNRVDLRIENDSNASTAISLSVYQNFTSGVQFVYLPSLGKCVRQPIPSNSTIILCTNQIPGMSYSGPISIGECSNSLYITSANQQTTSLIVSPTKCIPSIVRQVTTPASPIDCLLFHLPVRKF
jgi:hypothetical protein